MQVIEKVKVVPEGYNGAGMDGYNRRDVNGKANAGLTLGIIGTALGAWALFGNNRRSTLEMQTVTLLEIFMLLLMHSIMIIANCLRNGLVVTLMKRLLLVLLTFGSKMMILMATRYGSTSTRCNPYYN